MRNFQQKQTKKNEWKRDESGKGFPSILLEYLWWDKKTWTDFYLAKLSMNRILNNFKVVGYLAMILREFHHKQTEQIIMR